MLISDITARTRSPPPSLPIIPWHHHPPALPSFPTRRSSDLSPDGKRLAGGTNDETVKVWDAQTGRELVSLRGDRKSTRLNSSHRCISYAVFCLKKKTKNTLSHWKATQTPATLTSYTKNNLLL